MKHINYIGPFNRTGYGIASCGYLHGLIKHAKTKNTTVSFTPIGQIDQNDPELKRPEYQDIINSMPNAPKWDEPTVCFWHLSHIKHYFASATGLKVGISTFETSELLEVEKEGAQSANLIVTACKNNAEVLKKYSIKSTVIPHGCTFDGMAAKASTDKASETWETDLGISLKDHKILSTIGKFEVRKGFNELIQALFKSKNKYLLIAFWFNPFMEHGYPVKYFIENNWEPVVTKNGIRVFSKNNVKIAMMPTLPTREQVYSVAKNCHAYISCSKAEGWNLPLFDMMSFGVPCISTTNTAMADYAKGNVIDLSTDAIEIANDGQFFHGNRGFWEKLDVDHISKQIDFALTNNLAKLADKSYQSIAKLGYNWTTLGKQLYEVVDNEQRAFGKEKT